MSNCIIINRSPVSELRLSIVCGLIVSVLGMLGACTPLDNTVPGSLSATISYADGSEEQIIAGARTHSGGVNAFKAHVSDYGDRCTFSAELVDHDSGLRIEINTYADQVAELIAGDAQTLAAVDNGDRALFVNAATVYVRRGDDSWWSDHGEISIHRLPEPRNLITVEFRAVALLAMDPTLDATLTGTSEFTYEGRIQVSGVGSGCPHLTPYAAAE